MKKYLNILAAIFVAVLTTSCLDSDLEDLGEHSGCSIETANVYWRYYGSNVNSGTGEQEVKQVYLAAAREKDEENCTYKVRYALNNIPEAERPNFTESKMVVVLTVSQAAIVKPVGDAPTLGAPGDWTGDHQYEITAANGDKKVWTVIVEPYE